MSNTSLVDALSGSLPSGRIGQAAGKDFLDGLSKTKRAILVAALKEILAEQGIDVCRTEWGKNLGKGLCEFRVRDRGVVLRVFFHAHGDKRILLLSGYDKGRFGGGKRQAQAIQRARQYLSDYQNNT